VKRKKIGIEANFLDEVINFPANSRSGATGHASHRDHRSSACINVGIHAFDMKIDDAAGMSGTTTAKEVA
jgi:hypothetical protein